jgi:DNA-binding NarL/FixJ family response regulator
MADCPNESSPLRRLIVVDDHPVFRFGLSQMFSESSRFVICAEAPDARTALQIMRDHHPEFAIVDVALPGRNGIDLAKAMIAERPDLKILMLSLHSEPSFAVRAMRAGAKGYLLKDEALDWVLKALEVLAEGKVFVSPRLNRSLVLKSFQGDHRDLAHLVHSLTHREREILHHLGQGASTRTIAALFNLSIKTVETHRTHMKEKLKCSEQSELVQFATEWSIASAKEPRQPDDTGHSESN